MALLLHTVRMVLSLPLQRKKADTKTATIFCYQVTFLQFNYFWLARKAIQFVVLTYLTIISISRKITFSTKRSLYIDYILMINAPVEI